MTISQLIESAQILESAGLVMVLLVLLGLSFWVIRFLYRQRDECEDDRREQAKEIGKVSGALEALEFRIKAQEERAQMEALHAKTIELLTKKD